MVTPQEHEKNEASHFQPGGHCLLVVMGQRFMVGILSVTDETVRVSFPMNHLPAPGMRVELEFHDTQGYTSYESEVLETSHTVGDGLLLQRPPEMSRNRHRTSWRVSTDSKVHLKNHVHPRRFDAPILNISAGGMLIRTAMHLSVGDSIDLRFTLPGFEEEELLGRVAHINPDSIAGDEKDVGLEFVSPDPVSCRNLNSYVWSRLRSENPSSPPPATA